MHHWVFKTCDSPISSSSRRSKGKFLSESSRAEHPKREIIKRQMPSDRCQAKVPKRIIPKKDPKRKMPTETSQAKAHASSKAKNLKRTYPSVRRQFPGERSRAKVPKRTIPSEHYQAQVSETKLPSERSKAQVPKRASQGHAGIILFRTHPTKV